MLAAYCGIERQHEDLLAMRRAQLVERGADARIAVAHADLHRAQVGGVARALEMLAQVAQQQRALPQAVREQRRAVLGPDRPVAARGLRRPRVEDDAVQERLPRPRRDLDDARVGQEFLRGSGERPSWSARPACRGSRAGCRCAACGRAGTEARASRVASRLSRSCLRAPAFESAPRLRADRLLHERRPAERHALSGRAPCGSSATG